MDEGLKFCPKCQYAEENPSLEKVSAASSRMKVNPHRLEKSKCEKEGVKTPWGCSPRLVKIMNVVWPIVVGLLFGGWVVYVAHGRGVGWIGAIIIGVIATIWAFHDA